MYNMNQYRYHSINKNNGTKLKKLAYQLGVVLIVLLVLMLIKFTNNEIGANINEKVRDVFYRDYTDEAKKVLSSTFPAINSYLDKVTNRNESREDATEDFVLDEFPVDGEITSTFGTRVHPITNESETHTGIDIAVPEGTEVKAAHDGIVEEVKDDEHLGTVVVLNHNNGFKTVYGHLSEVKVNIGDDVSKGSIIALSGSTGLSTGPHLHFEVLFNGESVDPSNLLKSIAN